jgi:hypothetical protein
VHTGVSEAEFRWPTPPAPGGCSATGGEGAWLLSPSGVFYPNHPLSPAFPVGAGKPIVPWDEEWEQHGPTPVESGSCAAQGINSRTDGVARKVTNATGTGTTDVSPATTSGAGGGTYPYHLQYDAAANLKFDGRHWYQYDGQNRLKDVFRAEWSSGGAPVQGHKVAHFDHDAMGRLIRSQYDTNNSSVSSSDLSDEDAEWTPRDLLGRPLGVWRQPKPTSAESAPAPSPTSCSATTPAASAARGPTRAGGSWTARRSAGETPGPAAGSTTRPFATCRTSGATCRRWCTPSTG